ncbi:MAG: pyridoxine 5'-phosphate synthase [Acidobacteria bacterium]|nr:pyridoxine 5'-phosphate synthase [Acidobacteriota bacterium]
MRLGVNIDHVATVRQARLAPEPEPVATAVLAELAGAHGITVHLRGDRRHIQERDLELLRQVVATKLNVEMAATPEMIDIAARVKPHQVTLVPETPEELTTTGGLDVARHSAALRIVVQSVRRAGISTSLFIDADRAQVEAAAAEVGADAVEINTGPYADAAEDARAEQLERVAAAAAVAADRGLEVLAGHGLTYQNVGPIADIAAIEELNIGHSIVARAVLVGMERAVREMLALLRLSS